MPKRSSTNGLKPRVNLADRYPSRAGNSPTPEICDSPNNQLRKGAWLQRSFTLSTVNCLIRTADQARAKLLRSASLAIELRQWCEWSRGIGDIEGKVAR